MILFEIVLMVLCIGTIPVNMLFFKFSEWLIMIPILALLVYSIFCRKKLKKVGRIMQSIFVLLTIAITWFGAFANPYWNSSAIRRNVEYQSYEKVLTYEEAAADMKEMMGYLKKCHPMFRDGLSEEIEVRWQNGLENLKGMEQITTIDLARELQLILAPMGDAHTSTYTNFYDNRYLKDEIILGYEGWEIASINGMNVDRIKEQSKPYICYEVDEKISIDCGSWSTLQLYGIVKDVNTYEWMKESGERLIKEYTIDDFVGYDEYAALYYEYYPVEQTETEDSFVSYEIDEEKSLALLTLESCIYNQEYRDCIEQMFTEVKEKEIQNVAVDLRNNGGGNSLVANEVFRYLPQESYQFGASDWRLGPLLIPIGGAFTVDKQEELMFLGDFYVLTNSQSFSAAKDFAMMVVDNNIGTLIGEPPANSCYGYGDISYFSLEHSGIYFQVSTKKWYRADSTNPDLLVRPHIPCEGDEALEELYRLI